MTEPSLITMRAGRTGLGYEADSSLKFFGRRKGRALRASQQKLLEERLPDYALRPEMLETGGASLFSVDISALWMEVGFGSGEHLVQQASAHPDIGMIGCEPFINGVVKCVRDADRYQLENLKIYPDDARHILDLLPEGSLSRVYVLFPDPWPKTRHYMRRFVGPENLNRLSRVMTSGGELHCATDHSGYLEWMLFHIMRSSGFEWLAEGPDDWRCRPADQPQTRYEQKALAGKPFYLRFRRY